jgi:protein NEDD1
MAKSKTVSKTAKAAKATPPATMSTRRAAVAISAKTATKTKISSPLANKPVVGPRRTAPIDCGLKASRESTPSSEIDKDISIEFEALTAMKSKRIVASTDEATGKTTPHLSPPNANGRKPIRSTEKLASRSAASSQPGIKTKTSPNSSIKPTLVKSKAPSILYESQDRPPISKPSPFRGKKEATSPDLPTIDDDDPMSPITMVKGNHINVLGLGTPEVERWLQAGENLGPGKVGKGKGKAVEFDSSDEEGDTEQSPTNRLGKSSKGDKENQHSWKPASSMKENCMQLSPMRPSISHSASMPTIPSPLRPGLTNNQVGYDFLQSIIREVMYDYQQESKAELRGLHLDLIRAGRGWKKELGVLMEQYVGDLKELREENTRLREENERLRRGY